MAEKSRFKKFYDFDFFILPSIIKILMMVGIILCPIAAIIGWIGGEPRRYGVLVLILGPVVIRIWAEMFILIFKIVENTQKIADKK